MRNSKSKAELLKSIKNGKGIQHILDEAYRILSNPMVIHDMSYKLAGKTDGLPPDDPFCAEFIANGLLSDELIKFCVSESFIDSVSYSAAQDGVTYLISDKLKYDRVFGQLYNNNKMPVADLVMLSTGCPFDGDTTEHVKIICRILSKELGRDAYYHEYGQAYQEGILKKLIEGDIEDKAVYAAHVANIDAGLKSYIYTALARAPRYAGNRDALAQLRDELKKTKPEYKYYLYQDYTVILISSDNPSLSAKQRLAKLGAIFEREDMQVGISRSFENLFEMPVYYNQALEALNNGLENGGGKRIFLYG